MKEVQNDLAVQPVSSVAEERRLRLYRRIYGSLTFGPLAPASIVVANGRVTLVVDGEQRSEPLPAGGRRV